MGDLYIGFAQNLDYGLEAILEASGFNNGRPKYETGSAKLVLAPSDVPSTSFIYSESYIKNYWRYQNCKKIIDDPLTPTLIKEESEEQLRVWNQLNINNEIHGDSIAGSQIPILREVVRLQILPKFQISTPKSFEMDIYIDKEIGLEIGAYISGSGASAGGKINVKTEIGRSITNNYTHVNEVGYHLEDEDSKDKFELSVYSDKVFGTPCLN
ncbi:MAG: hypothetical protein R2769_10580 [Saprospiraceae bacterium]